MKRGSASRGIGAFFESLEIRRLLTGTISVVAKTGDSVGNGVFGGSSPQFQNASLNDVGQAAFVAELTATTGGSSDDSGVFRAGTGGVAQIVREGQAIPGVASATFYDLRFVSSSPSVAINGSGAVGFRALTNSITQGEFIGDGSTLSKIALAGDLTPEGDATFTGFRTAPINSSGQMSFNGAFATGGRAGDFRGSGGVLTSIARFGSLAPDGTNQYATTSLSASPTINNSGQVALRTAFRTPQGNPAGSGVVVSDGSTATVYDRSGSPIPDGTGTYAGSNTNTVAFNNVGQVAFLDTVTASPTYTGVFVGANGSTQRVARTGQPLPGSSITMTTLNAFDFNDNGAFVLKAGEGNTAHLMVGDATHGFTRIVGGNDPLPDGDGNFPNNFGDPAINNSGQVAFQSLIQFGSGNFFNDTGIFFYDASNGGLQVVARLGTPLLGSTISALNLQTATANRAGADVLIGHSFSGLNNLGQVAFNFTLADGRQGVAVWTPQTTTPTWLSPSAGALYSFSNNTLTVTAGTVTLTADAGTSNPGVSVVGSGSSAINFTTTQHLGSLTLTDSASVSLAAGGTNRVLSLTSLSIGASAKLDLNDNDLILHYTSSARSGSPLTAVQSLIRTARANGAWTGNGLTSSAAKNNPQHTTTLGTEESSDFATLHGGPFDGETVTGNAVLVKYTYNGDANFDGRITFDDYVRIDTGFNAHLTGWVNGDFNYSGAVNFDDYVLIDIAFNSQGQPLRRLDEGGTIPVVRSPGRANMR